MYHIYICVCFDLSSDRWQSSLFQCWFCFEKVKWTLPQKQSKTKQNKQTNIISNNNKHHIKTTVHNKKPIFVADVAVVSCFSWILSGSSLIIIIYICTLTHEIHRVRRLRVLPFLFSHTPSSGNSSPFCVGICCYARSLSWLRIVPYLLMQHVTAF